MRSIGKTYLHVSNSGVTFEVGDDGHGPTVLVSMGAFGNLSTKLEVKTTKEGLEELAAMFAKAAEASFSEPYCHAATPASARRGSDSDSVARAAAAAQNIESIVERASVPVSEIPPPNMTTTTLPHDEATASSSPVPQE